MSEKRKAKRAEYIGLNAYGLKLKKPMIVSVETDNRIVEATVGMCKCESRYFLVAVFGAAIKYQVSKLKALSPKPTA